MEALMKNKWLRSGFFEMLASPLADSHPRVGALLGVATLLMVLAGVGHFANRLVVRRVVLPVAGIWMIARIIEAFGNRHEPYANLSPVVGLAFSCSVLWAMLDHFQSDFQKTRNAITEAFISYLVLATAYSQLYWILNHFVDHAFNQAISSTQVGTFLYFSMITLTSIGYGGIAPLNPFVRIVAALESMSGIFFIAVVVARLVSSYRPKAIRPHRSPSEGTIASVQESACERERVEAVTVLSSY
jgi:hypothetical protein